MKKTNLLEEYMKQVEKEGLKNGIEFNETVQNSTSDIELSENEYVENLNQKGMLSDDIFKMFENKFNMDWEHVRQVSELAEAKEVLKKQLKKEEENKNMEYNERIKRLALSLREEAEKLK